MTDRRLRRLRGLRPLRLRRPPSAASVAYPQLANDFERPAKIACLKAHNEIDDIPARSTSEAVKDSSLRLDVERRMPLAMEWAKPNVLTARRSEIKNVSTHESEEIAALFHSSGIQRRRKPHHLLGAPKMLWRFFRIPATRRMFALSTGRSQAGVFGLRRAARQPFTRSSKLVAMFLPLMGAYLPSVLT